MAKTCHYCFYSPLIEGFDDISEDKSFCYGGCKEAYSGCDPEPTTGEPDQDDYK